MPNNQIKIEDNVPLPTSGRGAGDAFVEAIRTMKAGQSFAVTTEVEARQVQNAVTRWNKMRSADGWTRAITRAEGEGVRVWRT